MLTDYELKKLAKYVVKEAEESGALRRIIVPEKMLEVDEAAKMLGLSASYLRNNHGKIIPHKKIGRRLLFSLHDIEDLITAR